MPKLNFTLQFNNFGYDIKDDIFHVQQINHP